MDNSPDSDRHERDEKAVEKMKPEFEGQVFAPWTDEQVAALNAYQRKSGWHPFTCGNDRTDEAHLKYQKEHGGDWGELVATRDGWICPACDYTQSWATAFMIETGKAVLTEMDKK